MPDGPDNERFTWFNIDMTPHYGVGVVANLEEGLPFKDNSVTLILARSVMEHITKFLDLMKEVWRVLAKGGQILMVVPCFPCRAAVADPDHKRFFVPETFEHFVENRLGYDHNGMAGKFRYVEPIKKLIHDNGPIDEGVPGSYYTELFCRLAKC
jgi:predicted SAM-dependent methyltransferase